MKNLLTTTLSVLPEGIGTLISFIMFFVMDFFHLIQEYVTFLIVPACVTVLICLFLKETPVKRTLLWSSACILLLSLGSIVYSEIMLRNRSKVELISDATESIVEEYYSMLDNTQDETDWVLDAIDRHEVVFILVPSSVSISSVTSHIYDINKIETDLHDKSSLLLKKARWSEIRQNNVLVKSSYNLLWAYAPHLKNGWEYDGTIVLPHSSHLVLDGMRKLREKHWEAGRRMLEKADSLGNPAGAFYLSTWYGAGLNQEPDHEKERFYFEKAAKQGSRQARANYGKRLLNDMGSSSKRGEGIDYLRKASILNTVATEITIRKTEESLFAINDYYHRVGAHRDAYKLTKASTEASNNPNIKFIAHLNNCIVNRRYSEAHTIINEGKTYNDPNCLVVHAGMYALGNGETQNFNRADELLRYAADSLDYYPAYKGLAELYKESNREGAEFWYSLYQVRFSNRINSKKYE